MTLPWVLGADSSQCCRLCDHMGHDSPSCRDSSRGSMDVVAAEPPDTKSPATASIPRQTNASWTTVQVFSQGVPAAQEFKSRYLMIVQVVIDRLSASLLDQNVRPPHPTSFIIRPDSSASPAISPRFLVTAVTVWYVPSLVRVLIDQVVAVRSEELLGGAETAAKRKGVFAQRGWEIGATLQ